MPSAPTDRGMALDAREDNLVLGFRTVRSGIMGRLVRLGRVADEILSRHDYPAPVIEALGQSLVLATLLGAPLKEGARLILQTKTEGPLRFLVVNYESPGRLRGYASADAGEIAALAAKGAVAQGALLGKGLLAMTVDQGGEKDRYQGIVEIDGAPLAEAALSYFRQSEQLPTYLRLAVARQYLPGGAGDGWHWRAGGLLVQHLSPLGGATQAQAEEEEERMLGEDDDHWQRVRLLASTVEDHELLDPTLTPDSLLWRLFHEEGVVRAVDPMPLAAYCRCSRERVATMLKSFSGAEMADMREADGRIGVTCEFCNTNYRFTPEDVA